MQPDIREVIAYEDDVFVWVFLDQIDRVLRYEAYMMTTTSRVTRAR